MPNPWDNDPVVSPAPRPAAPARTGGGAVTTGRDSGNPWDDDPVVGAAPRASASDGQRQVGPGGIGYTFRPPAPAAPAPATPATPAVPAVPVIPATATAGGSGDVFGRSADADMAAARAQDRNLPGFAPTRLPAVEGAMQDFTTGAIPNALPGAAGFLAGMAGSVGGPVGAGVAGGLAAYWTRRGQDALMASLFPNAYRQFAASEAETAQRNPLGLAIGSAAPNLAFQGPGGLTRDSILGRAVGAGVGAGGTAAQDVLTGQPVRAQDLATSALLGGLISGRETPLGETAAQNVGDALARTGGTAFQRIADTAAPGRARDAARRAADALRGQGTRTVPGGEDAGRFGALADAAPGGPVPAGRIRGAGDLNAAVAQGRLAQQPPPPGGAYDATATDVPGDPDNIQYAGAVRVGARVLYTPSDGGAPEARVITSLVHHGDGTATALSAVEGSPEANQARQAAGLPMARAAADAGPRGGTREPTAALPARPAAQPAAEVPAAAPGTPAQAPQAPAGIPDAPGPSEAAPVHHSQLQPRDAEGHFAGPPAEPVETAPAPEPSGPASSLNARSAPEFAAHLTRQFGIDPETAKATATVADALRQTNGMTPEDYFGRFGVTRGARPPASGTMDAGGPGNADNARNARNDTAGAAGSPPGALAGRPSGAAADAGGDGAGGAQPENGLPAPAAAPAGRETPAGSAPDQLHFLDPAGVGVLPGMQYKRAGIVDEKAGVTGTLRNQKDYDVEQGGVWTVYRDENGRDWVVNGHHRADLANRAERFVRQSAQDGKIVATEAPRRVPAVVLDARDGWTPEMARTRGALENLRDGKGTAIDAADALAQMNAPDAIRREVAGLPDTALSRDVAGLVTLPESARQQVRNGEVKESAAAAIGRVLAADPERIKVAMEQARLNGIKSYDEAANMAARVREEPIVRKADAGQLGFEGMDGGGAEFVSTAGAQAKLRTAVESQLAKEKSSLLSVDKTQARPGEAFDVAGRRAEAAGIDTARSKSSLLFDYDPDVKSALRQAATDHLSGQIGADEAAARVRQALLANAHRTPAEVMRRAAESGAGTGDAAAASVATGIFSPSAQDGTGDAEQAAMLFQPGKPGEDAAADGRTLVALHNTSGAGILAADRLGGIPVPSLAVQKAEHPFTAFGDVTLVGRRQMVDPERSPLNNIYTSDVYSPRQPHASQKFAERGFRGMAKEINALAPYDEFGQDVDPYAFTIRTEGGRSRLIADMKDRPNVKAAYLRSLGEPVEVPRRAAPLPSPQTANYLSQSPSVAAFLKENPAVRFDGAAHRGDADYTAAGNLLRGAVDDFIGKVNAAAETDSDRLDAHDRQDMLDRLFDPNGDLLPRTYDSVTRNLDALRSPREEVDSYKLRDALDARLKQIDPDGRGIEKWLGDKMDAHGVWGDPYLDRGGKKLPYTLPNLVDAMTGNTRAQEKNMTFGLGEIRASGARKLPSIAAAHAREGSLVSDAEFETHRAAVKEKYEAIQSDLLPVAQQSGMSTWDALDNVGRALADYSKNLPAKPNPAKMRQSLAKFGFRSPGGDLVFDATALAHELQSMPTEYLESKPQRAVSLSEFAGAAVPHDTPQAVLDALKKHGLQVETYQSGDAAARQMAVARIAHQQADALFQKTGDAAGAAAPRASVEFAASKVNDARIVLRALNAPDASSALHELGHVARRDLYRAVADQGSINGITPEHLSRLEAWAGAKDGRWTVPAEEKFARGFERYVMDGRAPTPGLAAVFAHLKNAVAGVYAALRGAKADPSRVAISPEVREVFDRMLGQGKEFRDPFAVSDGSGGSDGAAGSTPAARPAPVLEGARGASDAPETPAAPASVPAGTPAVGSAAPPGPERVPVGGSGGGSVNLSRLSPAVTEADKAALRRAAEAEGADPGAEVAFLERVAREAAANPLHVADVRALRNPAKERVENGLSDDAYGVAARQLAADAGQKARLAQEAYEADPTPGNRAARDQAARDQVLALQHSAARSVGASRSLNAYKVLADPLSAAAPLAGVKADAVLSERTAQGAPPPTSRAYGGRNKVVTLDRSAVAADIAKRLGAVGPETLNQEVTGAGAQAPPPSREPETLNQEGAGKPSGQTETPEFRRWFGDSKVVDESGKPLVVYHGTPHEFDAFRPSSAPGWGRGIYLTDNRAQASEEFGGSEGNVKTLYAAIKNPWTDDKPLSSLDIEHTKAWENYKQKRGVLDDEYFSPDVDEIFHENGDFANAVLRERGYDGVVARGSNGINGLEIVAFHPEQVKSATGNRGTFDPADPNILHQSPAQHGLVDDLAEFGAFHYEAGSRRFDAWKNAMKADLGRGADKLTEGAWQAIYANARALIDAKVKAGGGVGSSRGVFAEEMGRVLGREGAADLVNAIRDLPNGEDVFDRLVTRGKGALSPQEQQGVVKAYVDALGRRAQDRQKGAAQARSLATADLMNLAAQDRKAAAADRLRALNAARRSAARGTAGAQAGLSDLDRFTAAIAPRFGGRSGAEAFRADVGDATLGKVVRGEELTDAERAALGDTALRHAPQNAARPVPPFAAASKQIGDAVRRTREQVRRQEVASRSPRQQVTAQLLKALPPDRAEELAPRLMDDIGAAGDDPKALAGVLSKWSATAGGNLLHAYRANLLSGPQTLSKIGLAHVLYLAGEEAKRVPAAAADALLSRAFGTERTVQGGSPLHAARAAGAAVARGVPEAGQILRGGEAAAMLSGATSRYHAPGTPLPAEFHAAGPVGAAANPAVRFPMRVHGALYTMLKAAAYDRSLGEQANLRARSEVREEQPGLAGRAFGDAVKAREAYHYAHPDEPLLEAARRASDEATFTNENAISTAWNHAKSGLPPAARVGADLLVPFGKVPVNVGLKAAEYTAGLPYGALRAAKAAYDAKAGRAEMTPELQRGIAENLGRGATGMGLAVLGYAVAKGLVPNAFGGAGITGVHPPDDKEHEYGSVTAGGRDWGVSQLQPVASPLFAGAYAAKYRDAGEPLPAAAAHALYASLGRGVADNPYLRASVNLHDLTSGDSPLAAYDVRRAAGGLLGGVVPAFLSQSAQQFDPQGAVRRKATAADYVTNRLPWENLLGVPGRYSLPPVTDRKTGQAVPEAGGLLGLPSVPTRY